MKTALSCRGVFGVAVSAEGDLQLSHRKDSVAYAPLARAIIGGLTSSVLLTIFIVPAAYLVVYRERHHP